jgi:signal peptidase
VASHGKLRRALGWVEAALVVAILAFWFFELRPQLLGGPASYAIVNGKSMLPHYRTGDIVIVHRHPEYGAGQVIAYKVPKGDVGGGAQVIHRIIGGNGRTGFVVQGDNRTAPDVWHPKTADVVGSAWVHLPGGGGVVKLLHTPAFLGGLGALVAVLLVVFHKPRERPEEELPVPAPASVPGADPSLRLMLPVAGEAPGGVPTCSRGCHVLLLGARFDPHTGEAIDQLVEPEPSPAAWPFWHTRLGPKQRYAEYELAPAYREVAAADGIDFEGLEREIHEAVRTGADVQETLGRLVGAIGEYGDHLQSHTASVKQLAGAAVELRATTVELREFLASLTAALTRLSDSSST